MLDIELLGNGLNKLRSELGPLVGNNFLGTPKQTQISSYKK